MITFEEREISRRPQSQPPVCLGRNYKELKHCNRCLYLDTCKKSTEKRKEILKNKLPG